MKKHIFVPLLTVLALSGLNAADQTGTNTPEKEKPNPMALNTKAMDGAAFAKKAAGIGLAEIETGKLAKAQAGNEEVKKFGQMMVTQHTEIADKLKAIATKQKLELPTTLDPKHQKLVEKLTPLRGADFDKAYMSAMVEGHEHAVALFKEAAASNPDPELKKFAAANLPILEMHLKDAQALHKAL